MSTKEEQYLKAKKRVEAKKGFYGHFGSFIAIMAFLFLLNFFTSFGNWWFIYPLLGWGASVLIHYFSVFGLPFVNHGDDWEEEAIRKEMEKMQRRGLPESSSGEEEFLDLPELKKEKDSKKWSEDDLV